MKKLLASLACLVFQACGPAAFADTPPQVINKTCSSNQFFNKIAPGPGNITCLQPTYSGIANTPTFVDSVTISSNIVTLVNDLLNPGNSKYYGTNSSGTRGFFDVTTDVNTIGTFDSATASANGAVISSNSLVFQSATTVVPGMVNNTTQSFSGNKTFTGTVGASNLSGTNTGDVTLGTANGLSLSGQALSLTTASTSTTGALTSTDWNTFNGKQASGNYITALTGDVVASGPGSAASTIQAGVVDNGKVSATAAIDFLKLAPLASANILVGSVANVATSTAVTGDVTISNAGVTSIGTNKVANAQLAQMSANSIKGNNTGSPANAADLTVAQVNTLIGDLLADGSVALSSNWNAGAHSITANSVAVGSAANTISALSTIINSGTLTLPTSTDTLVGRATTDTLTNKTLTGNTAANLISGAGTLTLNTTGTITVPSATDTLVGKATTDQLSGKTFAQNVLPEANNTRDLGATATRWANLWLGGNATVSGNIAATGTLSGSNFSGTSSGTNTGDVTIGAFGSTPNSNGLSLSSQAINLQPADGTNPGAVSTTTQTFAGAKTFSGNVTGASFIPSSSTVPTNGLYLSAANEVSLATNSAQRFSIGSSGTMTANTTDLEVSNTSSVFGRLISSGASQTAQFRLQTGATGGSAFITFQALASADWSMGEDASDGKFKIDNAASPGSNTRFSMTQAGVATMTGPLTVGGVTNASNAGTGNVGEILSASNSGINVGTTGQFSDVTHVDLTAGDWDLSVNAECYANGATVTVVGLGIGTASGNSSTGQVAGINFHSVAPPTAAYNSAVTIASYRVNISSTTTYYLKDYAEYSVATPQCRGLISGRRMR